MGKVYKRKPIPGIDKPRPMVLPHKPISLGEQKIIEPPKQISKPKEGNTKEKAKGFFAKIPKDVMKKAATMRCYATADPKRNAEIRESIKKREAAKK